MTIHFSKSLGMKDFNATLRLSIPLVGDVMKNFFHRGLNDYIFSGTKADFNLQTRAMIARHRMGRYKYGKTYRPGTYNLGASLIITKFGNSLRW